MNYCLLLSIKSIIINKVDSMYVHSVHILYILCMIKVRVR